MAEYAIEGHAASKVRAGPRTYLVSDDACVRGAHPYQDEWQHLVQRDDGTTVKVKQRTAQVMLSAAPDPEEWLRATRTLKKQCNARCAGAGAQEKKPTSAPKPTWRDVLKKDASASEDSETEEEDDIDIDNGNSDDGESECASEGAPSAAPLLLLAAKRKEQEQAAALEAAEQRIAQLTAQLAAQAIADPPSTQARPSAKGTGSKQMVLSPLNANRIAQNIPRATERYHLRSRVTPLVTHASHE